jgi:hypothetical protein
MLELPIADEAGVEPAYDFFAEIEAKALKRHQWIKKPKKDELFVDIDLDSEYQCFLGRFKMLVSSWRTNHIGWPTFTETPSKSGLPKRHIVVKIPGVDFTKNEWRRLTLQFFLSSDPRREALNTLRMLIMNDPVNILFENYEQKEDSK